MKAEKLNRRTLDGWKFDFSRALLTGAIYVGLFAFGMSQSFLYGGGFAGTWPLLLALFGGAWPAAWISCKLLPTQRRMAPWLAGGIYAGFFVCWMLLGLTSVLLPKWPNNDPRTRFMARHDAALVIIPFCMFFILGPMVVSRLRNNWRG